jgi:hydrogenase expression/formation protein HypC
MCYAIPAKIIELKNDVAKVDYGGITKEANCSLVADVSIGDYVLIHAGFAIEKLDKDSAESSLSLMQEMVDKVEIDKSEKVNKLKNVGELDE